MTPEEVYDLVTARLRRHTAAAWIRWPDLPPEARWQWEHYHQRVLDRLEEA